MVKRDEYYDAKNEGIIIDYPDEPDQSEYLAYSEESVFSNTEVSITLDEGLLLVIEINGKGILVIQESKGLFME